jgi:hypothetical protein
MKRKTIGLLLIILLGAYGSLRSQDIPKTFSGSFSVTVHNPLNADRRDVLVFIPAALIGKEVKRFNLEAFALLDGAQEIPSQYNTKDEDLRGIVAVLDGLKANEDRVLTIRYAKKGSVKRSYPKRTQAELSHKFGGKFVNREYIGGEFRNVTTLRVPPEHKDHSWFIRYEGPGWESDKVAYRFYLDQRNASDVFGKTTHDLVLQQVGLDGFESYHHLQPWGMDVLKAGKSLGIASIATLQAGAAVRVEKTDSVSCRITENGDVYSSILTNYSGWQFAGKRHDLTSRISIHAGTRLTHQQLSVTGDPDNLCTGIVKDKAAPLVSSLGDAQHFGHIATYGKQSLNSDDLGLAIFFPAGQALQVTEDAYSHIVTLKPANGKLDYYFLAAWSQEPGGITSGEDFRAYVGQVASELANPVTVTLRK